MAAYLTGITCEVFHSVRALSLEKHGEISKQIFQHSCFFIKRRRRRDDKQQEGLRRMISNLCPNHLLLPFISIIYSKTSSSHFRCQLFNKCPTSKCNETSMYIAVQYCHLKGVVGWGKKFTYHFSFWPSLHNPLGGYNQGCKQQNTLIQHVIHSVFGHRHLGCLRHLLEKTSKFGFRPRLKNENQKRSDVIVHFQRVINCSVPSHLSQIKPF